MLAASRERSDERTSSKEQQGSEMSVNEVLREAADVGVSLPSLGSAQPRESAAPHPRWRRPRLTIPFAALTGGLHWTRADGELARPIREGDPRIEVARRDAIFRRSLALADLLSAT